MKQKLRVLQPSLPLSVLIIFGMFVLYHVAFQSIFSKTYLFYFEEVAITIFYSRSNLQKLLKLAVSIHILEAFYSLYLTLTHDYKLKETTIWTLQTLILGYPSLRLLKLQIKENYK